ncbi:MAG: S-layer homology domain-containing protein [Cyanobacteria bacterium TGS_CYA1]|nr:S-layer homology domain-containing protein [Cyanobacteria bacterium TGS_CYA1]
MSSFPRLVVLANAGLLIGTMFFGGYAAGVNVRAIRLDAGKPEGIAAKHITRTETGDADHSKGEVATAVTGSTGSTTGTTQISQTSTSSTTGTSSGIATTAEKFSDIEKTDRRLVPSLIAAANAGVLDVSADNLFHPNDPVTRADFTRWMVRTKQIPKVPAEAQSYADVAKDNKYFDDIETATASQMVQGYPRKGSSEKDFKPDNFITREEFAVMYGTFSGKRSRAEKLAETDIKDYLRYDSKTSSICPAAYRDEGEIDDWARKWVAIAQQTGVIDQAFDCAPNNSEDPKRYLHPQKRMTRAEAVNILVKLYGVSAQSSMKDKEK